MQGMSGSPVYIDGKLVGAVAMAFPYAKDPIAGIRPIEEMLNVDTTAGRPPIAAPQRPRQASTRSLAHLCLPAASAAGFGDTRMTEVATPLSLSGFTASGRRTVRARNAQAGARTAPGNFAPAARRRTGWAIRSKLQPGSMISVELMTGDMSVGADGTLTCIDGNKVYAFGHRFLAVGPTDLALYALGSDGAAGQREYFVQDLVRP